MKIAVSAFVALGLLTSGAALATRGLDKRPAHDLEANVSGGGREHFRLSGADASCIVTKGPVAANGASELTVGQDCDAVLPGLSSAHYWEEDADGIVSLSADGSQALAIFSVADGVAYESLSPARPLMVLAAAD